VFPATSSAIKSRGIPPRLASSAQDNMASVFLCSKKSRSTGHNPIHSTRGSKLRNRACWAAKASSGTSPNSCWAGTARYGSAMAPPPSPKPCGATLKAPCNQTPPHCDSTRNRMIDLYYWTTPNGHKITLFLEETGLPYTIIPVNIGKGDQFQPDFLKIAPNSRIPAIVDRAPADGGTAISLFESGAILLYLAEKTGQCMPNTLRGRSDVLQWLFWQMGGLGPMAGQNHHFNTYAQEKIPYAIDRYVRETGRLYGVLNKQLADREFIAHDYSIADMACYPWIVPHERQN